MIAELQDVTHSGLFQRILSDPCALAVADALADSFVGVSNHRWHSELLRDLFPGRPSRHLARGGAWGSVSRRRRDRGRPETRPAIETRGIT
jgi:hypothetical protein